MNLKHDLFRYRVGIGMGLIVLVVLIVLGRCSVRLMMKSHVSGYEDGWRDGYNTGMEDMRKTSAAEDWPCKPMTVPVNPYYNGRGGSR